MRGNGGDRYVKARTCGTGLGVLERRPGLLERDLIVHKIDGHEHITGMHELSFDHWNFKHVSVDPRAQRHDVTIYLCVVSRLPRQAIPEEEPTGYDHNREEQQRRGPSAYRMLVKNPAAALLLLAAAGQFWGCRRYRGGICFLELRLLCRHLVPSEILAKTDSCHTEGTNERQLCEIVAIEAGDVLVVGAGQGLFGLHHLDAVGDACRKTFLGAGDVVVGGTHIPMSDINLLPGGIQIEKCGANVVVNLPADVLCFRLPLAQSRFCLCYVAFDPSTGVDRYIDPRLEAEDSVRLTERWSLVTVIATDSYDGITFALGGRQRPIGRFRRIESRAEVTARVVSHREGVFDRRRMDVRIRKLVRNLEGLAKR